MSAKVSVIIPNYNHELFLKQRVESVINQTYQDFELIILDDCSTDNSREIIEQYRAHPKVKCIVYNSENSGSTFKQWNKGVNLAEGEYVWIAESDDYCELNFLETLLTIQETTYNIGITYCKSLPINQKNAVYDYSNSWIKRVDNYRWEHNYTNSGINECCNYLSVQCTIPNVSAVLFKIYCLQGIDWEKINYVVCGDWYVYALILKNHDVAYVSNPLNYHRNHYNNARSKFKKESIIEQYNVLRHINQSFKINKTPIYYKALDERMGNVISLLKSGLLSKKDFLGLIPYMYSIDAYFLFRFFKIAVFKILNINRNFI
jgi:glycosyltransferase involved in cell wall biosynthesis